MVDSDEAEPGLVVNELSASADWVELYNPGSEPVTLDGLFLSDDYTDKQRLALTGQLGPGAHALLSELPFGLAASGEAVGVFDSDGQPVDWVTFPRLPEDEVYARIPDGGDWLQVAFGTPGAPNEELYIGTHILVGAGADWAYLDDGVEQSGWSEPGFDDSGWAVGAAPLGYGDAQATEVSYGDDSSAKHVTTWVRHTFDVDDAEIVREAELGLMCDDGCLVHLNGVEVARHNLPSGDITAETFALEAASGAAETAWNVFEFAGDELVDGDNVLAVEVHQATLGSSDLGFDLYLDVTVLTSE